MLDYRQYEFKFDLIELYEKQEEYFAIWCRGDYLVGEVLMSNGDVGYLGQTVLGDSKLIHYILDLSYKPIARYCQVLEMMLDIKYFDDFERGKWGKSGVSCFVTSYRQKERQRKMVLPEKVCAITKTSNDLDIEHLMPVSSCIDYPFGNSETNCYYLHKSLNRSKSNKNVFEWIEDMTQLHLNNLLSPYEIFIELETFKQRMYMKIAELSESIGISFDEYKELYQSNYRV